MISVRTRRAFQESYSSLATLRLIEQDFADAGLRRIELRDRTLVSGERRTLVEEYYAGIHWNRREDEGRVLQAFEAHLDRLESGEQRAELERLLGCLRRDGFEYAVGRITRFGRRPITPQSADDLWRADHFRLFLSHVSSFKKNATTLGDRLLKYRISSFVAHEQIRPSREWQNEINRALATMDALVALLTDGFHESYWTDQEIGYALGRGVLVVSVNRDLDPYGFIARHQAVPGRNATVREVAARIFKVLVQHDQTRPRMVEALLAGLAAAENSARARMLVGHLEAVPILVADELNTLRGVAGTNQAVATATGMTERIETLATRAR